MRLFLYCLGGCIVIGALLGAAVRACLPGTWKPLQEATEPDNSREGL